MKEQEMDFIAELMDKALTNLNNEAVYSEIKGQVKALCERFPFYSRMYRI